MNPKPAIYLQKFAIISIMSILFFSLIAIGGCNNSNDKMNFAESIHPYISFVPLLVVIIVLIVLLQIRKISKQINETKTMLLESEKRYEIIFENAAEGICIVDVVTKKNMFVNTSFCKLFGYTKGELLQLGISDLHPNEVVKENIAEFENIAREEKSFVNDVLCLKKGGSYFFADIIAKPLMIDGRKMNVAFFTDITERKRSDDKLLESEERYKVLFQNAVEGIHIADIDAKKSVFANRSFCQMFGYAENEIAKLSILDMHPKQYKERVIFEFESVARKEKTQLFGIPCLKKDGSVFFADIFASPMIIDGKKMNVGFFTDVTERKTAEEKLKLSEEKFSKIFYTSPDAIGINRLHDGLYLDVNDGFTKITGYAKEELIGKTSQELSVWANPKDRIRLVNQLLKNKNVTNLEAEFRMKDGSIFSGSMSAIIIEINNEPCIISITRNITERKKIERDQKFFNQILLVLNGDLDLKKMIASVMKLVQEETKFSAVGIRLKQGDDFPYFDQIGFSNNFLLTENKLIAANSDGNICKDENGKPFLECTCGMVISEKINHSNQLLTKAGSFWTNDSYPLLELLPDQDPRFHPRNNCIHFGYGSVAIIPIRANNITIGTLQLNEKKKNAFTNETISFFETICLSIGNAFMRKQTEKLLTDSQHQLLTFMNESPLSIYFVNAKTMKIIYANPFFFNTLDYLQDEMNSISIFDFIHAPKAEVEKFLSDVYQTKESKTISRQWKKRDGEILDMLVNVSYVKQNETETLFISAQNISETQRLERQLQESHKVLSNIFKSLEKETFWSRDLITDKMLYISPGIEKLFGKPLEGFLHNQNLWSEVIHPEDRKKAAEALRNSNGKSFSQEYRIIMPDESIKWIHSSVIVSNENGKSVRADGSLYDITEIKLLNEQLNEKIKDMNMFIYRASHDLRGPLSTVMGLSELGKTEAGTNKQMNFYFDKISYSIGRLDNIIQELSKIGRITQVPIKIERINIKNEINEIINSLKSLPDFSKVKFTVDIETHDILTDKVFIIMALQNIIANAINYIDAKKSNHAVSIHAYEESGKNKIVISDNGIGIDNEIQDKVFDMFYRGSEQSSGSGLGLYIVKHTIQKLEGNIFLSSEKGKGTTFTIQLPKNINEEKWR